MSARGRRVVLHFAGSNREFAAWLATLVAGRGVTGRG